MKVSREQVMENRGRILDAAAALFRERGFDGVAVAEVMQRAGLTHGAFYGYFESKEALALAAATHALGEATAWWASALEKAGAAGLQRITDAYLSPRHRDDPATGCAIATLGPELARQPAAARGDFTAALRAHVEALAAFLPGDAATRRRRATALLAQLVGAIVLARVVDDGALSSEILAAVRGTLRTRSNKKNPAGS